MPEEEKKEEEQPKEEAPKETEESPLDRGERIMKMLEEQNKIFERNIHRQEEITAKQMLAGRSGVHTDEQPKEESPQEYKDRIMKGQLKDGEG